MASTRTTSRNTAHSTKARRSRIFKDKLNMRDEIIVAGDESDAKRLPSREPRSSPLVVCHDGTSIPPTEPTEASDQHLIPPDGEDTLSTGWYTPKPEEFDSVTMPPPGWPLDGKRGWNPLQRQISSSIPGLSRSQPNSAGPFSLFFGSAIAGDGSPRDDASSVDPYQDDNKSVLAQQAPAAPGRVKSSRASTTTRRNTKQASASKSSRRSRKGASRDDHDQEGDCLMGEVDAPKKQEDNGPWVCPFFREDPTRHMDCITLTLNRIQDVKQHLTRRHTAELYCSRCFQEFQLHQDWEEHTQRWDCPKRPCPPHRVTPQAQDRLKVRVDRTLTASEQWYDIWRILFGDKKLPHSPQQGSVIGEVIGIIRDCWNGESGQILSELARSEGISEGEARILGRLLPGLLDRVQDRVDPPQRDSGVSDAPSNASSNTAYMTDQAGQTIDMGGPAFLAPTSDYSATPKLSKSPSPTTPILLSISDSNFQPLMKSEQFVYDPSSQEDSFDQMMEQPYTTSTENDELTAMTFSGQLEGNCLESRGIQPGFSYNMDPILSFPWTADSAFGANALTPEQYPNSIEMYDRNDVTGELVLPRLFDYPNARGADLTPMANQPLKQSCQGDANIR